MAEETIFERLDVQYEERDGIFYPLLSTEKSENVDVGKYGHLWMNYIKEEFPIRYNSLLRFGNLEERAAEVNEVAYELLADIEAELMEQHKPKNRNSFVEMYAIRSQVRAVAEEVVLHDVVRQFH